MEFVLALESRDVSHLSEEEFQHFMNQSEKELEKEE
jgi:hypothetical protein